MICIHNSVCTDSRRCLDAKGYDRLRFLEDMTVARKYVDCTLLETESSADAEDSSYDSDYEAEDAVGPTNIQSQVELQVSTSKHLDVSRTISDTLAVEFAEYVTVQGSPPAQSPGYAARVEFALKLGYTERLVQTALEKLGPDPEQNELLAELIKLGATRSQKTVDTTTELECVVDIDMAFNETTGSSTMLRPIVIDGSNVAMSHGNKKVFSCRGIRICVDWFRARGHTEITVFVPKWRKEASRIDNPIADQEILGDLERDRLLVFTPSRLVGGKRMICYDDRYILKLAAEIYGIVVSNDNYRDLAAENPEFRKVIEERILMYTFVNDRFMPPDDPLGRSGPTLDNFLKAFPTKNDPTTPCPYAKKCTYGNKCKFRHPERGSSAQKSVTEKLVEHVQKHLHVRGPSTNLLLSSTTSTITAKHQPLCKTRSTTSTSTHSQTLPSVTKSKSAENVAIDPPTNSSVHGTQALPTTSSQGFRSSQWSAGGTSKPDAEPSSVHRKLQRQLTLNPVSDSRLCQLRRYQQASQTSTSAQRSTVTPSGVQHKPVIRHSSHELPRKASGNCDHLEGRQHHQHATRLASAPEAYHQPWRPQSANLLYDPQLNASFNMLYAGFPSAMLKDFLDARTETYYYLTNKFPEKQVKLAMLLEPFEVDPVEIMIGMSKMFPME